MAITIITISILLRVYCRPSNKSQKGERGLYFINILQIAIIRAHMKIAPITSFCLVSAQYNIDYTKKKITGPTINRKERMPVILDILYICFVRGDFFIKHLAVPFLLIVPHSFLLFLPYHSGVSYIVLVILYSILLAH